jgi:hypothetical protein
MALAGSWRRWRNFRRWKRSTTPMLLNTDTGELVPFASHIVLSTGKWMLRRPLTLPDSPVPLFLEAPLIPGGPAKRKCGETTNRAGHQAEVLQNREASVCPPPAH